jgi:large subunit ribosomal protein L29
MKYSEVKEMTDAELNAKVLELEKEKFTLKCQSRTGELSNSAAIRGIKRDIARIKTELRAREMKAAAGSEA